MAQWGIVQVGVPDAIIDLTEIIEGFARALLAILNIALKILQIIKAFLVGFLNPLLVIVEAIIDEIEAFLNDIRQLGIYLSGDLNPEWPLDELLGGFGAYERRMIGRLTNRSDPTRPNFSSRSVVIAVFLYISVDVTALATLIVLIHRILQFFGQPGTIRQFSTPTGLEATYGTAGASITRFGAVKPAFGTSGIQDAAMLRWSMAPPVKASPINWPLPAPFGFLIEVSIVPDGLLLAWESPTRTQEPAGDGQQTRTFGFVGDPTGAPFRLYGGVDQFDQGGIDLYSAGIKSDGKLKPGACRLVAMRDVNDPAPIPITALKKDGDQYLLQRTFFRQMGGFAALRAIGQGFSFQLKADEMPWNAEFEVGNDGQVTATATEQATTAYVRVAAVSRNVRDETTYKWQVTEQLIASASQANQIVMVDVVQGGELNYQDRGPPSAPLVVTFPGASTAAYLDAVTAALAVMVLSRSDLPLGDLEGLTGAKQAELDELEEEIANQTREVESQQILIDATLAAGNTPSNQTIANYQALQDDLFKLTQKRKRVITQVDGTAKQETGLEDLAKHLFPMVIGRNPSKFFKRVRISPVKARRGILRRCRNAANRLYSLTGNQGTSIEELVVERGADLIGDNAFKWSDFSTNLPTLTILESLDTTTPSGASTCQGVGLNPFALGKDPDDLEVIYRTTSTTIPRNPGFWQNEDASTAAFVAGEGSADLSPVVYARQGMLMSDVYFARNVWYSHPEVYSSAALVLSIAAAPLTLGGQGGWIAFRLLPQGIPPIESMLDTILLWMETIKAGIQGIIDIILRYIEFVEARILEIQAIIVRILGLLNQILRLQVPAASGLVVVTNGTDGVLAELITAENKPADSPASYGAGVVLLSGGLNASLAALLGSFFSES